MKLAINNLDIVNEEKDALFNAIWENFETYEIITYKSSEQGNSFITQIKKRIFRGDNFKIAY